MNIWETSSEKAFDNYCPPSSSLDPMVSFSHQSSPTSLKFLLPFWFPFRHKCLWFLSLLPLSFYPLFRGYSPSFMDSITANILMAPTYLSLSLELQTSVSNFQLDISVCLAVLQGAKTKTIKITLLYLPFRPASLTVFQVLLNANTIQPVATQRFGSYA